MTGSLTWFIPGRRAVIWIGASLAVLILVLFIFTRFFLDERLRRTIEQNANLRLHGYALHISGLRFHPIGFSLDLIDAQITQDAYPDPPVAHIPWLHASVHWGALLHGRLVSDFLIDQPKLNINLKQAKHEVKTKEPISERGWQDALEEIYPLKVNLFTVQDADITYVDEGPFRPLRLTKVNFQADNIRNVHSREKVYPSGVHFAAVVFDTGEAAFEGNADFLAKPTPGIKGNLSLNHIELDYFRPITSRYNTSVRNGVFSTDGDVEFAADKKVADFKHVTVEGVNVDFIHKPQTATAEQEMGYKVASTARNLSNKPEVVVKVDRVDFVKSRFGFVNKAASPEYQLFFSDADLRLRNLSNQSAEGTATGIFSGKFMGSGATVVNVAMQPKAKSGDFDLKIAINGTDLTRMNDLLKAYANFDVASGQFSFYSEVAVQNGQVNGYIKPLFKDVNVYSAEKDAGKSFSEKLRQGIVGALAWILSNRSRNEIATAVTLTGKFDGPQYSSWEAFGGLLKNAFIKALTPGFEANERAGVTPDKQIQQGSSSQSSVPPPG